MNDTNRLHSLDAVRGFALLLGVVFHAGFSFIPGMIPGIWAAADSSPSPQLSGTLFVLHMFRMSLFFFIAGFFARMLFHRRGVRDFWANRGKRIAAPLVIGWLVLFPAIAAVWGWGISQAYGGTPPAPPANMPAPPPGWFPLTHLWFLYYLLLLYALVTGVRAAFVGLDSGGRARAFIDTVVNRVVRSGAAVVLLAVPVALAMYSQRPWMLWLGIQTPDSSLIPQLAPIIGYGTAVAFGWLVHRQAGLLNVWARYWPLHLIGAIAGSAVCLSIVGPVMAFPPAQPSPQTLLYASVYALTIWCWIFAITGLAVRFLANESPVRRYIADSSYWIYLVHLPVVAAGQVLVSKWDLHWSLKFPLLLAASLAVLFASYHVLVRHTFIGEVLNGRRVPRRGRAAQTSVNAEPAADVLAELDNVRKSYGKALAVDGLSMQVRRGELLAVLGPNGAGKSTAISLWLGLLQADEGTVRLMGGSPLDVESRRSVGVMMQEVALEPGLRVRELLDLAASYYPEPMTVQETVQLTRIESLINRPYAKLSAGQKRQVQFALAVVGRPKLLFMDEPTVGLDVQARQLMWETIRELVKRGCSIVLTTHYLEEAEMLADRVIVIANGKLVASGSVDEVRSVVSRKQIVCSSALPAEEVTSWPSVIDVRREANKLQITVIDAESVVRRLLAEDGELRDLEVRQAGLAEAFTHLTKEAA